MRSSAEPDKIVCKFCAYEPPIYRPLPEGFAPNQSETVSHEQRLTFYRNHLLEHQIEELKRAARS